MKRPPTKPSGIVSIADALIALDGLSGAQRKAAWQWLPELVGLAQVSRAPADKGAHGSDAPQDQRVDQIRRQRRLRRERQSDTPEMDQGEEHDRDRAEHRRRDAPTLPYQLERRDVPGRDPQWLAGERDELGEAKPLRFGDLPPLEPLFEPRRTRSVISSALATRQADGELDIAAILERITRRQPLAELPRRYVPTTRMGLQLLLDRGQAMTPYLRDQEMLAAEIRNTVGKGQVEELRFADLPSHGVGVGPATRWIHPHRSPARGTPVVILTDLGIGRRRQTAAGAPTEEWLRFAQRQKSAGCPLLAIVPYDLGRVPRPLRLKFWLLPWSRTTTVATVRQLIGRGLARTR